MTKDSFRSYVRAARRHANSRFWRGEWDVSWARLKYTNDQKHILTYRRRDGTLHYWSGGGQVSGGLEAIFAFEEATGLNAIGDLELHPEDLLS